MHQTVLSDKKQFSKNIFLSLLMLVVLFPPRIAVLAMNISPVSNLVLYNRDAALLWAKTNNYKDGISRGVGSGANDVGRHCTTFIAGALNAGGVPSVPSTWSGNNQIVEWLIANPGLWEERPLTQLIGGDFVLLSTNSNAPANWRNPAFRYQWGHVMLVIAQNRMAEWNPEHYN